MSGTPVSFTTQTIKGISYAMFNATSGSYQAVYGGGSSDGGPELRVSEPNERDRRQLDRNGDSQRSGADGRGGGDPCQQQYGGRPGCGAKCYSAGRIDQCDVLGHNEYSDQFNAR